VIMRSSVWVGAAAVAVLCASLGICADPGVSIDVRTGESTPLGQPEAEPAWPEDGVDLSGVHVKLLEGEDPQGSSSPKELIIRSFQRLPLAEQERMGFTALYQEGMDLDNVDGAALQELWEERQGELKEAMAAMQDAADTLTTLINHLGSQDQDTVKAALEELEEHLSDVDMARDLHDALGGWPPLVHLLAGEHRPTIRAGAALVIGTAIKNEPIFQSWILESAAENTEVKPPQNETALSSLLGMLGEKGGAEVQLMHRRSMYALASALRHNLHNQATFMDLDGLDVLETLLSEHCGGSTLSNPALVSKLAALVHDILREEEDIGFGWREVEAVEDLHHQLGSRRWAQHVAKCLARPGHRRVQEGLLRALERQVHFMLPTSQWKLLEEESEMLSALEGARQTYCRAGGGHSNNGGSSDIDDDDDDPNAEACSLAKTCITKLSAG